MIRFGSLVPQGWRREFTGWEKPGKEFDAIKSVTLECERLGYDSFSSTTVLLPIAEPTADLL